jgi:chemotaxis protein MotB
MVGTVVIAMSLAVAFSGCMFKSDHLKAMDAQQADLKQQAADAMAAEQKRAADEKSAYEQADQQREAGMNADHDKTKRALADLTAKGGDCAKNLVICQGETADARAKLERVTASIAKVRDALKVMSDAGKLSVKVARGFLVISMSGDILFDSGKFELKEEAKAVLIELAGVLKTMPDRLFQVAGHTDNAGAEDLNWKLSMQRALSVVQFLIKSGLDGKTLSAGGYAMYQPVADNGTKEGQQSNRRVEFLLIPNLTELLNLK